ncbi:MAG: MFS transporter [Humibacillus sp.]|nr:MFS transporter [Humibacillus sp.]MDN5778152.1 MFS transporter [Humibacillus sp.]
MTASVEANSPPQKGLFYGWWIVMVGVLLMATIFGTVINSFSLFINPVIAELKGISIAAFTLAYTAITLAGIPMSPLVGNLLKKVDARWIVTAGVILAAVANVILANAQNVATIYLAAALQGIALTAATTIPIASMIVNWFVRLRGTALGIATAGSGLGSLIFVPLIKFYLLPGVGWRSTYLVLAVIQVVVLVPLAVLVLRNTPEQKGLKPLGWEEAALLDVHGATEQHPGLTQRQVYRTPAFWLLAVALIFSGISVNGMVANLDPILGALNSPVVVAGFILSTIGLFVMAGKFITGILFDKLPLMVAIIIVSLANAVQFAFMLSPSSITSGALFGFLHGFGATMVTVTPAYLASKLFGERDYSAVYGSVSVFALGGAALAPIFGGFFYGGATTSDNNHATSLVWAWLVMGLIGLGFYIVTVLSKPKWEVQDAPFAGPVRT